MRILLGDGCSGTQTARHPANLPIFDGEKEARVITLASSTPLEGRSRWTLQLLAYTLVELKIVESISDSTVCRVLKNELKPHLCQSWVIPLKENGELVARMEGIIDPYQRPYDPQVPVICMDEQSLQLIEEVRTPLSMEPNHPIRYD